jgi:large subunit ribosomal protein L13
MKTVFVNPKEVDRKWYVVDADGVVLGKLATMVATYLRGKHKAEFSPHQELGDYVIVINAEKVRLTGRKASQKIYYHHTGYTGHLRTKNFEEMVSRRPTYPVEHAIRGMLPKNRLGRKLFNNVKVYAGPNHPHSAQRPETLTIS